MNGFTSDPMLSSPQVKWQENVLDQSICTRHSLINYFSLLITIFLFGIELKLKIFFF